jgi:hypothetical protein
MTDTAKKTSELATANTIAGSDRLVFLYQANSASPSTRTVSLNNVANSISLSRLRNSNATFSMSNTGIITVTTGNTVGYIGDLELSNGIDIYSSDGEGSIWVTLAYSYTGNDAANTEVTGYAYLRTSFSTPNTVSFNIELPKSNGQAASWVFEPETNTIVFPDNTEQTTAYNISGPYANSTLAAAGGVAINGLYYDSDGNVKIRLT